MKTVFGVFFVIALLAIIIKKLFKPKQIFEQPNEDIEKNILQNHVKFYINLTDQEKKRFEKAVHDFLAQTRITAIETSIESMDRVFVAAAAVIPIFYLNGWQYPNISEVLIYPDSFNEQYKTKGEARNVLGMVGTGAMHHEMILSKDALRQGFLITNDKFNTGIHEFAHLIDNSDGETNGVLQNFLPEDKMEEWLTVVHQEINKIKNGDSDIYDYAATNQAEFFAVVSEYFFEQPKIMKDKHPELYNLLSMIYIPKK